MRSAAFVLAAALLVPALVSAAPAFTFEARAVSLAGVTPKARVAWFSVAREIEESTARIVRRDAMATDDDGDGVVHYELDRDLPPHSIWVAVDLATGGAVVATPGDFPLRDVTQERAASGLGREPGGPAWTETGRNMLELLVVRPGVGAWGLLVADGGEADDSPAGDGRLVAGLTRMRAVGQGGPAAPDLFSLGDLVFAIDPDRMEYFADQVTEP
jgi:hypothetical protein